MTSPSDIGEAIRQARKSRGLRQDELAALAGVGLRFLVDLEHGKPAVQLDRALAVLAALGLELKVAPRQPPRGPPSLS